VAKYIAMFMNLVTPKAAAKRELYVPTNKPVLSVIQIYKCERNDFGHALLLLKSDLDVQQTHLRTI
jgi:hypothetical protein